MNPVKMIIAGVGNPHVYGYLRNLQKEREHIRLLAFSEANSTLYDGAQAILKSLGIQVPAYTDFRDMLDRHPEAEAIMVGSDNGHHMPMFREAFSRDLHIYSMKVPTMIAEEGAELLELKARSRKTFQVELELRHGPQFLKARELVRAGALGGIQAISLSNVSQSPICYFPNWGVPELSYGARIPLRPGATRYRGGALTDHPHPFDLIRWITGLEFAEVTAFSSRNQRDYLEVEDHLVLSGKLTDGTAVMINPSYSNLEERATTRRLYWPKSLECNLKVFGEKGCYYADYFDHPAYVLGENHASPNRLIVDGVMRKNKGPTLIQRFAQRVRGASSEVLDTNLEDGLAAVKVMNAAYDSLYQGKTIKL